MNSLIPAQHDNLTPYGTLPAAYPDADRSTPFEQVLAAIYRQRLVLMVAIGLGLLVAGLFSLTQPDRYTASASIQIEQQLPKVMANNDLDPETSTADAERFLQTQLDLLSSRSLAEAVTQRLKLGDREDALKALELDLVPGQPGTRAAVAEYLQTAVVPKLGLNTRLARIEITTTDPQWSARIANAYAQELAEANIDGKLRTSNNAARYLMKQMAEAKQRLESSEQQMLAYARRADLTTTVVASKSNDGNGDSLRAQELGQMTNSLASATARRIDAQQRWSQVQGTAALALPEVQSNGAVQSLVAQRAQLQAALEEERQRHTAAYPSVKETEAKIAELDTQIGAFASSIQSSFKGQYLAAAQQERQMQQTVAQLKGAAMSERERSVGYNALSREVETNRAFYDGLLQRYKEIAAASGAMAANVTLVDAAWPPSLPDPSHLVRNLALGATAGLLIALLIGGMRERAHRIVRSAGDLQNGLALPALGVVPRALRALPMRDALDDPMSAQAEAYHSIAVALDSAAGGLPKTLLITSANPSEGKSTSALGIARSLAAMRRRVLLVDGDLRRPSTTFLSNDTTKPGFADLLERISGVDRSVDREIDEPFGVVRAGEAPSNPVALLAVDRIRRVFERLAAKHDIIIIDGPPILGLADAVQLARSVDSVMVVVEANRTHMSELDNALSRLPQDNLVGGVITKFDSKTAGVRYGSYDYYGYGEQRSAVPATQ